AGVISVAVQSRHTGPTTGASRNDEERVSYDPTKSLALVGVEISCAFAAFSARHRRPIPRRRRTAEMTAQEMRVSDSAPMTSKFPKTAAHFPAKKATANWSNSPAIHPNLFPARPLVGVFNADGAGGEPTS